MGEISRLSPDELKKLAKSFGQTGTEVTSADQILKQNSKNWMEDYCKKNGLPENSDINEIIRHILNN